MHALWQVEIQSMASCLENKTKLIPEAEVDKLAPR